MPVALAALSGLMSSNEVRDAPRRPRGSGPVAWRSGMAAHGRPMGRPSKLGLLRQLQPHRGTSGAAVSRASVAVGFCNSTTFDLQTRLLDVPVTAGGLAPMSAARVVQTVESVAGIAPFDVIVQSSAQNGVSRVLVTRVTLDETGLCRERSRRAEVPVPAEVVVPTPHPANDVGPATSVMPGRHSKHRSK